MKFNGLKKALRQYFTFTRGERNGIFILCLILFLIVIANLIVDNIEVKEQYDFTEIKKAIAEWKQANSDKTIRSHYSYFQFNPNTISEEKLDSLNLPGRIKQNLLKYRKKGGRFYKREDILNLYGMNDSIYSTIKNYILIERKGKPRRKQLAKPEQIEYNYFDPNKASSEELKKNGFSNFQIRNIIGYRNKGGVFKKKSDLNKIYGVDSAFYNRVKNWIRIEINSDVSYTPFQKHISTIVELNSADSILLISLTGIGPVFASRIIAFRSILGGFHTKKQLLEVYNFSDEDYLKIEKQLVVDTSLICRMNINFANYKTLVKHPYISKETSRRIIAYRDKHGVYKSCKQLVSDDVISNADFNKIKYYIEVN